MRLRLKFNKFSFANSVFTETMDKRTRMIFERAFSPARKRIIRIGTAEDGSAILKRVVDVPHDHRDHVRNIMLVFSSMIGLPIAICVQAAKTGEPMALQRAFGKIASKLGEKEREITYVNSEGNTVRQPHRAIQLRAMEELHFINFVRDQWDYALNLRHPGDKIKAHAGSEAA